jgi:predicted nucleotidyltransferase
MSSVSIEWRGAESPEKRESYDAEIRRITGELIARGALLVVLFGSRAREAASEGSDADILAVLPHPSGRSALSRLADLYAEIVPRGVDLVVYTPEELAEMKRVSSFVREALEMGKVLHAA